MNTRERCMNILHYKAADRMPAVHFGYWSELLLEWAEQGHISKEMAIAAAADSSQAQQELDKIIGAAVRNAREAARLSDGEHHDRHSNPCSG